jgi:hypothetical protein
MAARNRFDPVEHRYFAGARELISVTTLLKNEGRIDDRYFTEESRERGSWVHARATEIDLGLPVRDTVKRFDDAGVWIGDLVAPEEWRARLDGYLAFRSLVPLSFLTVEEPIFRPDLGLGGRPDRTFELRGRAGILDIKTGPRETWHGVQMALYDVMLGGLPPGTRHRAGVYLDERGGFTFHLFDSREDVVEAFNLAALARERFA